MLKSEQYPFRCLIINVILAANYTQIADSIISLAIAGEKKLTTTLPYPLSIHNDRNALDFFTNFNNLSLLFSNNAGDRKNCREVYNDDLIELWSKESELNYVNNIGATDKDERCKLFETTSTTKLFALNLHAINVVGIKMIIPSCRNNEHLPEYQITLLTHKLEATGSKPAVWLFNKLMNSNSSNKQDNDDRGMTAFTRFTLVPFELGERSQEILISANVCYQMCIDIPSTSMLPINVQALEAKIGEVVEKSVAREHEEGLKRFAGACNFWFSRSSESTNTKEVKSNPRMRIPVFQRLAKK